MIGYQDPVTRRALAEDVIAAEREAWLMQSTAIVKEIAAETPQALAQTIYIRLDQLGEARRGERPPVPPTPHAPESNLVDHIFLTSAIAYCLLPADPQTDLLRLAALTHEFAPATRVEVATKVDPTAGAFLERAWAMLDAQATALEATTAGTLATMAGAPPPPERPLYLLWQAHLAASAPLYNQTLHCPDGATLKVIARRADFDEHPLAAVSEQVGLVFGGATKIKAYVFESAKLPELRGGSVLLDRLNLDYSRKLFADAPECIIYAAGGDLLALAPAAVAAEKAAALEAAYTRTTLTAQAVAASTRLSLLELQYGRTPQAYWADDYQQECDSGAPAKVALLRSYYGDPTHKQEPAWTDTMLFHLRKCFGEVVGTVALQRLRRREGNPPLQASDAEDNTQTVADGDAGLRALPHFETLPHGQFCTSCDRRMAIARIPDLEDDLCEPCLRKRWIGWRTRYGNVRPYGIPDLVRTIERTESVMKAATDWRPEEFEREVGIDAYKAWYHAFQDYLDQALGDEELRSDVPADLAALRTAYLANVRGVSWESRTPVDGPSTDYPGIWPAYTFTEIGQAATPAGYIGLVYADGNNVGALIERIRTPAAYRQFARRLFAANQRAVFEALARNLRPTVVRDDKERSVLIHPFEIISIGGDDLILIVPAEQALPIALEISDTLERLFVGEEPRAAATGQAASTTANRTYAEIATEAQRIAPPPAEQADKAPPLTVTLPGRPVISMAAGVLLAPHTTPFFFMTELTEELLKRAKSKAKAQKQCGDWGSTIDFMALKSVAMVTTKIEAFRAAALTKPSADDPKAVQRTTLHLTARPYTTVELNALLNTVRSLKIADFPRTQLYQLRTLLPQGRFAATIGYLYFTSRLRLGWMALLRRHIDDGWRSAQPGPAPWLYQETDRRGITHWETVLGDLIELYEFVPKPTATTPNAEATEEAAKRALVEEETHHD